MSYKVWCAKTKAAKLEFVDWEPLPLGDFDAEVDITHCGICHTDKHLIDDDWKCSRYPLVCGHEGVGNVSAVGKQVTHLKIGDRIGIGFLRGSCGSCPNCTKGEENLCYKGCVGVMLGDAKNNGCFAKKVRLSSQWCFKLPDALDSVAAAPLMCAGITVYTPLRMHCKPGTKVGIIGIGGLGHLGIQFARAMGCHVVAFSTTASKEQEAKSHGAHEFVDIGDKQKMATKINSIEFLLNTAPNPVAYDDWAGYLVPGGKFCIVGIPASSSLSIAVVPFVFTGKSVVSSVVGGRSYTQDMLELAATHKIRPQTEVWDFKDINGAIDHLLANKARYRIVLKF